MLKVLKESDNDQSYRLIRSAYAKHMLIGLYALAVQVSSLLSDPFAVYRIWRIRTCLFHFLMHQIHTWRPMVVRRPWIVIDFDLSWQIWSLHPDFCTIRLRFWNSWNYPVLKRKLWKTLVKTIDSVLRSLYTEGITKISKSILHSHNNLLSRN